jgi:hypothetical protein
MDFAEDRRLRHQWRLRLRQPAMSFGIVSAGLTEDKADVNARIAWSGVGINLATNEPTRRAHCARRSARCRKSPLIACTQPRWPTSSQGSTHEAKFLASSARLLRTGRQRAQNWQSSCCLSEATHLARGVAGTAIPLRTGIIDSDSSKAADPAVQNDEAPPPLA